MHQPRGDLTAMSRRIEDAYRKMVGGVAVAVAAAMGVAATSTPASAAERVYIYAPSSVRSVFPVETEMQRIDYYTGSFNVLSYCRVGVRCVKIWSTTNGPCGPSYAGCAAYDKPSGWWTLYLNPYIANTPAKRRAVTLHELGHAFNLWQHHTRQGACGYAMYYNITCWNGRPVGVDFTPDERYILARS